MPTHIGTFWDCIHCQRNIEPGREYISVVNDFEENGVMCLKCAMVANFKSNGGFLGIYTTDELLESGMIKFRPELQHVKSREKSVKRLLN